MKEYSLLHFIFLILVTFSPPQKMLIGFTFARFIMYFVNSGLLRSSEVTIHHLKVEKLKQFFFKIEKLKNKTKEK